MFASLFFVNNELIPNHNITFVCEKFDKEFEVALYEPVMKQVLFYHYDENDDSKFCIRLVISLKLFKVLKHKWK
jgi:hypothetical protein